jgi:hypothetical protein
MKALEEILRASQEPYGLSQDPARKRYPNLWEHLTVHQCESGRSKQVATLSIVATPTGFTTTLRDMTLSVSLTSESESLDDCLPALERLLDSPRPPWKTTRHGERANNLKGQDAKKLAPWEKRM